MSILRKSLAISTLFMLSLALLLATVPNVKAQTGTIRIETPDGEYWPVMVGSPATFEIWVEGTGSIPTNDPHILLVMTEACLNGLMDDVVVSWTGDGIDDTVSFSIGDFQAVTDNSADVPDSGTTPGARYKVASLKDHLDEGLSVPISPTETIYWAMAAFLDAPLTDSHQTFTVTLPSTAPRMLVYALGKNEGSELFDNKVPPTRPGFVVPELGTILLAAASFSALALYALKRRKYSP